MLSFHPVLCVLYLVSGSVWSYEMGPPVEERPEICDDMFPHGHEAVAQTDTSPFLYTVYSDSCYGSADQTLLVKLNTTNATIFFEGFFIEARSPSGGNQSFGVFTSNNDPEYEGLKCHGSPVTNTLGHAAHVHWYQILFTWNPPSGFRDDFQFVGTVVRRQITFWMNVKSDVIRYNPNCNFKVTFPSPCSSSAEISTATTVRRVILGMVIAHVIHLMKLQ